MIGRDALIRTAGVVVTLAYSTFIVWLYATQPQTMAQVQGGALASFGLYRIDQAAFDDGLRFFHNDQFIEARAAFARADPAMRDATTQFYVAYSFYRQGWHRTHHDDALYKQGLETVTRAIELAPGGALKVTDPKLAMHDAVELKAELEAGLRRDASDFNPLRLFESRK